MVDGHQTIQGAWPGWPEEFASGIDCAFYGAGTESETIYFLKGDQFMTYNLDVDRVTSEPRPNHQRMAEAGAVLPPTAVIPGGVVSSHDVLW